MLVGEKFSKMLVVLIPLLRHPNVPQFPVKQTVLPEEEPKNPPDLPNEQALGESGKYFLEYLFHRYLLPIEAPLVFQKNMDQLFAPTELHRKAILPDSSKLRDQDRVAKCSVTCS